MLLIFLTLTAVVGAGCNGDSDELPLVPMGEVVLFDDLFYPILNNMIDRFWQPSGDWLGDQQGDATAFAPMLLYRLALERRAPWLAERATRTAEWELALIRRVFSLRLEGLDDLMNVVTGGPALIEACRYTEEPRYCRSAELGLHGANLMARTVPWAFVFFFDPVVAMAVSADCSLDLAGVTGDNALREEGLALIDLADIKYWREADGYYGTTCWDWPEATMLMALAEAYRDTSSPLYWDRAERLIKTTDCALWDGERGGYYGHITSGPRAKALSGNSIFCRASLDWYEITREPFFLDRAVRILEFCRNDLYAEDILWHHWTPGEGRAEDFCTGCNFFALVNIYRLNKLIMEEDLASFARSMTKRSRALSRSYQLQSKRTLSNNAAP